MNIKIRPLLFAFPFLGPSFALGGEGMVIVLESPLFHSPNQEQVVIQYVRKGEKIYIHDEDLNLITNGEPLPNGMFRTVDKNGQEAFVLSEHIKPIIGDNKDDLFPIAPRPRDKTEYRLSEPIEQNYAFQDPNNYRAAFFLQWGPSEKNHYPYAKNLNKGDFSPQVGFQGQYLKRAPFDLYNRIYFGAAFSFMQESAQITLTNNARCDEKKMFFNLGPMLSYDFFKSKKWTLTSFGSILATYNTHSVIQEETPNGLEDEKFFSSFFLKPLVGMQISKLNIFPQMDFLFKSEIHTELPHSEKSSRESIDRPFSVQLKLGVGLQSNY